MLSFIPLTHVLKHQDIGTRLSEKINKQFLAMDSIKILDLIYDNDAEKIYLMSNYWKAHNLASEGLLSLGQSQVLPS